MSSSNLPVRSSSTNPRATSIGEGKTDVGKTPDNEIAVQTNNAQRRTTNGRMRSLEETGLSFTIDSEAGRKLSLSHDTSTSQTRQNGFLIGEDAGLVFHHAVELRLILEN